MNFTIELEQENDGRWIAEVLELRGTLVYGQTRQEAIAKGRDGGCPESAMVLF
jgi:predicted RNase H-like HicB family nuclease